ncbi:MAG TPA: carboxypeptidase-like regulatory domain-containing protein, partial [Niastella sp.]
MNRLYQSDYCLQLLCILMLGSICLIIPDHAAGQEAAIKRTEVSGAVKDVNGQGLAGATVRSKNGPQATSTDINGKFKLNVTGANPVLIVSFIGYISKEVPVEGNATSLDVILNADQGELAQVAVVGYGTQSKKDVTG